MDNNDTQGQATRLINAARMIGEPIASGRSPTDTQIAQAMDEAFDSAATSRGWSERDASEAVEIAIIATLLQRSEEISRLAENPWLALYEIETIAALEPKQTGRSREQRRHQNYSTPIAIAWAAAIAADLKPQDRILEPSAGLGAIAIAVRIACPQAQLHLNEIEPVRHTVLKELFPEATHSSCDALALKAGTGALFAESEGAEAPFDIAILNPPFSASAQTGKRRNGEDIRHVAAAVERVRAQGRVVAITSREAKPGHPKWDHSISDALGATTLWSKQMDKDGFANKGLNIQTRMTIVEPASVQAGRPWIEAYDEVFDRAEAFIGSALTECAYRCEASKE